MWSFDTYGLLETGRIYYRAPLNLLQIISDLLHSIYGFSDAKGNILSITTKLDKGKLYFPLGTSKGWDNPIKRTVLIVDADEEKELHFNLEPQYSAYRGGRHSYIFEFIDANPTEDLEAGIGSSSIGERALAWNASAIYDTTSWLTFGHGGDHLPCPVVHRSPVREAHFQKGMQGASSRSSHGGTSWRGKGAGQRPRD